jgi:cold shock CspA family protein
MNNLGRTGWEFVTTYTDPAGRPVFVFKRPLPQSKIDRDPCRARARPTLCWSAFGDGNGYGYREVGQSDKGFIQPSGGGSRDVFVHISAVERAGLSSLNEGQTVEYEIDKSRIKVRHLRGAPVLQEFG